MIHNRALMIAPVIATLAICIASPSMVFASQVDEFDHEAAYCVDKCTQSNPTLASPEDSGPSGNIASQEASYRSNLAFDGYDLFGPPRLNLWLDGLRSLPLTYV